MKLSRGAASLLVPAGLAFLGLLVLPLVLMVEESFLKYVPGRVGAAADAPFTLENYALLIEPAYIQYFLDTFRLSMIAAFLGLGIGFPMAYVVARQRKAWIRKSLVGILISMMFLSGLVRVYSIQLTLGPVGFGLELSGLFGASVNSRFYTEATVIAGLLHYIVPMSALTLIGTLQNINPRLVDAALSLGASRIVSHLKITLPLSIRGLVSAFLISLTLSISAFVIPMILGKGRVLFVSNLIYRRFSEVANYPSGAAISITMMVISLGVIYALTRIAMARWGRT